jgi:hypothetical protein
MKAQRSAHGRRRVQSELLGFSLLFERPAQDAQRGVVLFVG